MTDHSTETEQTSMTTMTNVNLKQEILSTLHSELTQLIKQDLQPIQADIQSLQNTIQMQAEQQHTKMQTFNSNLSTSHEHFKQQMAQISDQFQEQLRAQQQQFDAQIQALFVHLSSHYPPSAPPSTAEGGMH